MSPSNQTESVTQEIFADPIVMLAALCPLCALAAISPVAALAALSPTLRIFNPAINPAAALLSFTLSNPGAQLTARVSGRVGNRLTQLATKTHMRLYL